MSYDYLNLKAGAPQRLRRLRRNAEETDKKHPKDKPRTWRDVRYANLRTTESLSGGWNSTDNGPLAPKRQIWYTQSGQFFKREEFVDEVEGSRIDHRGWFSDADCDNTYRGIVVKLPHGRFLAGYYMSDNGERVYFDTIYTDINDAINEADSEAQRLAEDEKEYNERWREARDLQDECEEIMKRIEELWALRHHPKLGESSGEELREKLEELREKRNKLATDYKDVDL